MSSRAPHRLTRAIVDYVEQRTCVDRSLIFASGFSNGGFESYRYFFFFKNSWAMRNAQPVDELTPEPALWPSGRPVALQVGL